LNSNQLREGAAHTLFHCVSLIEDAALLFEQNRIPSCFVIVVMAREELGRFNLLQDAVKFVEHGASIDLKTLRTKLSDHTKKLAAGQSTFFLSMLPSVESLLERLTRYKLQRETDSSALHKSRLKAQYVDIDNNGKWSRPNQTDPEEVKKLLHVVMTEVCNTILGVQNSRHDLEAFRVAQLQVPNPDVLMSIVYRSLLPR
jgi:AbiV family abortive infection protein